MYLVLQIFKKIRIVSRCWASPWWRSRVLLSHIHSAMDIADQAELRGQVPAGEVCTGGSGPAGLPRSGGYRGGKRLVRKSGQSARSCVPGLSLDFSSGLEAGEAAEPEQRTVLCREGHEEVKGGQRRKQARQRG